MGGEVGLKVLLEGGEVGEGEPGEGRGGEAVGGEVVDEVVRGGEGGLEEVVVDEVVDGRGRLGTVEEVGSKTVVEERHEVGVVIEDVLPMEGVVVAQ